MRHPSWILSALFVGACTVPNPALRDDPPPPRPATHCAGCVEVPWCGDAVVDPGEECDDGNDVDTDGCRVTCRFATCGDGVVMQGEEACDDGNDDDDDDCRSDCTISPTATCENGEHDVGEICFDEPRLLEVPTPAAAAALDADRDGDQDLVVASASDAVVHVLRNNGHGAFPSRELLPLELGGLAVVDRPESMAVGDFNGDQWPDIAVGGDSIRNVMLRLSVDDDILGGTAVVILPWAGMNRLATADLDGDKQDDLLVISETPDAGGDQHLWVYLTSDDDLESVELDLNLGELEPHAMAVGNLVSNAWMSLAIADGSSGGLRILGFATDPLAALVDDELLDLGARPEALVIGDVVGDASPDLVVISWDEETCPPGKPSDCAPGKALVLPGGVAHAGALEVQDARTVGEMPTDVSVAQLRPGLGPGVVTANAISADASLAWENGSHERIAGAAIGGRAALVTADFNADGVDDLATIHRVDDAVVVLTSRQ